MVCGQPKEIQACGGFHNCCQWTAVVNINEHCLIDGHKTNKYCKCSYEQIMFHIQQSFGREKKDNY